MLHSFGRSSYSESDKQYVEVLRSSLLKGNYNVRHRTLEEEIMLRTIATLELHGFSFLSSHLTAYTTSPLPHTIHSLI